MRLRSLRHIVGEAIALTCSEKIYVLGSSSLLASFSDLGEDGGPLSTTYDADLLLDPTNAVIAKNVGKRIGENSPFHVETGYHADIVHPDITATLPPDWVVRLVPLEDYPNAFCLDPYDVAAVKIVVGRDKDLSLVKSLLEMGKIEAGKLRERFHTMPLGERELFKAGRNLTNVIDGR